jgi:HAE1 family hydrophobic/amphiphilic exporter-1/multidrug efflux pump
MYVKTIKGELIQMDNIVSTEEQSLHSYIIITDSCQLQYQLLFQAKVLVMVLKAEEIRAKVLDDTFTTDLGENQEIL